jgi:hypothetical protein
MIGQFTRLLEYTFHKEAGQSGLSCQPPGARQFPFSRDLDLHTSRLLPLTSDPPRRRERRGSERLALSQLSTHHSQRFLIELSTMLFLRFYRQPTTHNLPRLLLPAKRNWRDAVVLAPRSGTGRRRRLASPQSAANVSLSLNSPRSAVSICREAL